MGAYARLDHQPLFGKGARAPPVSGRDADQTRESGGNRAKAYAYLRRNVRGCLAAQLGPKRPREFNLRLLVTTSVSPFGQGLTPNIVVNRRKKKYVLSWKLPVCCSGMGHPVM